LEIRGSRRSVLSQQGWAMVIFVGDMAATGQRGSVQPPSPARYTNSMPFGLRQLSMVGAEVVYPVAVLVTFTGRAPAARAARTPST
jgi:hypothetical protein